MLRKLFIDNCKAFVYTLIMVISAANLIIVTIEPMFSIGIYLEEPP
ncbi:MAG: hypothetical protein HY097_11375 [Nitrospinae bacterium]|nr:hypothetical protein [Nitrospinota bacterium]MBI3812862.1 hypothetical protein [Nitrospinota bacterium]